VKAQYSGLLFIVSFTIQAQTGKDLNPFDKVFQGMFNYEDPSWYIPETGSPPDPPPVPLDGGLTALLLGGGAAGYRQYKKRKV